MALDRKSPPIAQKARKDGAPSSSSVMGLTRGGGRKPVLGALVELQFLGGTHFNDNDGAGEGAVLWAAPGTDWCGGRDWRIGRGRDAGTGI